MHNAFQHVCVRTCRNSLEKISADDFAALGYSFRLQGEGAGNHGRQVVKDTPQARVSGKDRSEK